MASLILFIICIVIFVFYLLSKRPKNFPPGPPKLPIWGSYWFLLKENYNFLHISLEKLAQRYDTNILGFFLGNQACVVTLDYQLTKEVLTKFEFEGRTTDSSIIKMRSSGPAKGIFFTDGPLWKSHRRFSLRHLRDYGFGKRSDVMANFLSDEIRYLINCLNNPPKKENSDVCRGKGLILVPEFFNGTLINASMLVLASSHLDPQKARIYGKAAYNLVKAFDATGGAIAITPWLRFVAPNFFKYSPIKHNCAILEELMKELVEEHLQNFSDDCHRDFIDDFISENIKQGTNLDYKQLCLTAVDYMFPSSAAAGHTIGFFFALLINYPHVQAKIHNEIDQVVGCSRFPSLDDRQNLPFFDATFREVMRFLPLTPLSVARRCLEDTTLGGYFIPKDTIMFPNFWTAHKDETIFQNPEQFKPERFLNSDGSLKKKDFTMSFGGGRRSCAAETFARNTIFLVMSCLLQHFNIRSFDGKTIDLNNLEWGFTLSLKETWMRFEPREVISNSYLYTGCTI